MLKIKALTLNHLILGTLLVYVTLHLMEEWLLGFPAWAELRWGIPGYTVSKWLFHNVYFAFFLTLGYLVYRRNNEKFLAMGLGIVVWGLLNSLNHIIFTLIFLEISPGIFTGFIFLFFAILTWRKVRGTEKSSGKLWALSSFFGLAYWIVPIVLFISIDSMLGI
ncbi:MAG TPA: HXXEE domain-containing protein [Chloroflexi bacterium]|nr:HXXEE domain-containing protein [Chloroflexota bacterium]